LTWASAAGSGAPVRRVVARGLLRLDLHRASGGTSSSGIGTRSTTSIPDATSASCFMFDMDISRSIRRTPSQWSTSGISCWKRASCTPATHSVRSK
jgi:hypothetical protein